MQLTEGSFNRGVPPPGLKCRMSGVLKLLLGCGRGTLYAFVHIGAPCTDRPKAHSVTCATFVTSSLQTPGATTCAALSNSSYPACLSLTPETGCPSLGVTCAALLFEPVRLGCCGYLCRSLAGAGLSECSLCSASLHAVAVTIHYNTYLSSGASLSDAIQQSPPVTSWVHHKHCSTRPLVEWSMHANMHTAMHAHV